LRSSDSWLRRDELDADPEAVRADIAAANDARNARWSELEETFKPKARLDAISTVLKSAMKLTETTSLAHAIDLYRGLDEPLRAVERYLPDAVKAWGEMVQRDIDIALGK
jgi:hypothetical protein